MKQLLSCCMIYVSLLCINSQQAYGQYDDKRFIDLRQELELQIESEGLNEVVTAEIQSSNIQLSNLLFAISQLHDLNITVAPEIANTEIVNKFPRVEIIDLFIYLCKTYQLDIEFTGNIIGFVPYKLKEEVQEKPDVFISYQPRDSLISVNAENHSIAEVFREFSRVTPFNLLYAPSIANLKVDYFAENAKVEKAINAFAINNDLVYIRDGSFFNFQKAENTSNNSNLNFDWSNKGLKVLDYEYQLLEVSFNQVPIHQIIKTLADKLDLDVFTATPLEQMGSVTYENKSVSLDNLLKDIFKLRSPDGSKENQNLTGQNANSLTSQGEYFTFKKQNGIYYFGLNTDLNLRTIKKIALQYRSVEMLADPMGGSTTRRNAGRSNGFAGANMAFNNMNSLNSFNQGAFNNQGNNFNNQNNINNQNNYRNTRNNSNQNNFDQVSILNLIPEELTTGLELKVDYELNSIYANGTAQAIEQLEEFIRTIDKAVPVVLIEVMILEVNRSAIVETGVSWGLGNEAASTSGNIFPNADVQLGANTVNRIIGGFDVFDTFNIGKVVPNFFARVKAMEANGLLNIKSTPKLSTLSGHRATFSNGQTSYYPVTQQSIIGANNPVTSEVTNYVPIDAELGLSIKPLVSGNGQVTLDIFVVQSNFGSRIDADAPPDINSREFSSLIRVSDQDIVVLGGLEEQVKDDSGTGVPLLARIPIIKWLFSEKRREDSKTKLTILIKPTIFE